MIAKKYFTIKIIIIGLLVISFTSVVWAITDDESEQLARNWEQALAAWQNRSLIWQNTENADLLEASWQSLPEMVEVAVTHLKFSSQELLTSQDVINENTLSLQKQAADQLEILANYQSQLIDLETDKRSDFINTFIPDWRSTKILINTISAQVLLSQLNNLTTYLDNEMNEIDVRIIAATRAEIEVGIQEKEFANLLQDYAEIKNDIKKVRDLWPIGEQIKTTVLQEGMTILNNSQTQLSDIAQRMNDLAQSLDDSLKSYVPPVENEINNTDNEGSIDSLEKTGEVISDLKN